MDDTAVVVVKCWPAQTATWDGLHGLSGPVPILFSEQPHELRTLLEQDPDNFAAELNKFMLR